MPRNVSQDYSTIGWRSTVTKKWNVSFSLSTLLHQTYGQITTYLKYQRKMFNMFAVIIRPRCCLYSDSGLPIVTDHSRGPSVGLCVSDCLSRGLWKTPERIRMLFGMVGRTGPWMRQIVGFGDRSTGTGNLGGKYGAPHCNQWGHFTIGNSHRDAARLLLAEFLELQARRAGKACRLSARCG